jgi:hypothetical protein
MDSEARSRFRTKWYEQDISLALNRDRSLEAEKRVYVTESHHHVLHAWAELRCSLDKAPRLFTLDYHTDTRPTFVGFGTANENTARSWKDVAAEVRSSSRWLARSSTSVLAKPSLVRGDGPGFAYRLTTMLV